MDGTLRCNGVLLRSQSSAALLPILTRIQRSHRSARESGSDRRRWNPPPLNLRRSRSRSRSKSPRVHACGTRGLGGPGVAEVGGAPEGLGALPPARVPPGCRWGCRRRQHRAAYWSSTRARTGSTAPASGSLWQSHQKCSRQHSRRRQGQLARPHEQAAQRLTQGQHPRSHGLHRARKRQGQQPRSTGSTAPARDRQHPRH